MPTPDTLPAPAMNRTAAGVQGRARLNLEAADLIVAVGDYTAGASEDMFTATTHGLITGDQLHVVWQSAIGVVTGGEATRAFVNRLGADTFQLRNVWGETSRTLPTGRPFSSLVATS